jgi:non-heme chloroperoxidase
MYKQLLLPVIGLLFLIGSSAQAQPVRSIFFPHSVKSVQLSAGVNLQYAEQGDETGVPVILLHGFTDSWRSYELVLPYLPATVHAFALSQRGHGDSDKPFNGYDPADFANDVADFMDALQIKQAIIVGHSMGSVIAQKFAIDHPSRTLGIVLIGSFAGFAHNEMIQGFQTVLDTLNDPIEQQFALEFQQGTLANPVPEIFLSIVVQESLKVPSRVWKTTAKALFQSNYVEALKKVTKPALIVWGDKDVLSPRKDQDVLAGALIRSQLVVYTGTGHAVHWEEPEKFANDLVVFAQQLISPK